MRKKAVHDVYQGVLVELRTAELRGDPEPAYSASARETRVVAGVLCEIETTFRVGCVVDEPELRQHATLVCVSIGALGGVQWFSTGRFDSREDAPRGLRFDAFRAYKAAYARAGDALRHSQRFKAHLALTEAAAISRSTRAPAPRQGSASRL
ncbi:hypothetical protein [Ramlibacter sp.]|uniref:hypothetical protein n=1 Tax=Ramlibacter sp. TaxID=1917967 RepID=UPI003D0D3A0A